MKHVSVGTLERERERERERESYTLKKIIIKVNKSNSFLVIYKSKNR